MLQYHAKNLVEEKVTNQTSTTPLKEMMIEDPNPSKSNGIQDKSSKICCCCRRDFQPRLERNC